MASLDIVSIIGNLSHSLTPVQFLLSGLSYTLGMLFFMIALVKLKKQAGSHSEKLLPPLTYLFGGAALIYLPSAVHILANTTFGMGNILQYSPPAPYDFYKALGLLIQTAGLIWFIRGCVLLIHSSDPQAKHGSKGLVFLFAGILAMNFQNTGQMLNSMMDKLESFTLTVKASQGY